MPDKSIRKGRPPLAGPSSTATRAKVGLPPGKGVYVGREPSSPVRLARIRYTRDRIEETAVLDPDDCRPQDGEGVSWINVTGIHDAELTGRVGGQIGLHALQIEDILNTAHRPKVEVSEGRVFLILKMLRLDEGDGLDVEQLSLVLLPGTLVTFQEREGDVLEVVRRRLRDGVGRIRQAGPDYLTYALLDAVVDHYFLVLDRVADRLEDLEERVMTAPARDLMGRMNDVRHTLIAVRRAVWPLREVVRTMQDRGMALVGEAVEPFLRDLYDHTVQVAEMVETFRDVLSGLQDLYLSSLSHRMNEVMKVLTVIGTVFIPLTFVVGVYGMNFEHMPELRWRFGYGIVMAVCALVAGGLLFWFRRRRWV